MCHLMKMLIERQQRSKAERKVPQIVTMAGTSKPRNALFVIPGTRSSGGSDASREMIAVPLQSLQMGGKGMTMHVVKELRFWCMTTSHECKLRDLIITSTDTNGGASGLSGGQA